MRGGGARLNVALPDAVLVSAGCLKPAGAVKDGECEVMIPNRECLMSDNNNCQNNLAYGI